MSCVSTNKLEYVSANRMLVFRDSLLASSLANQMLLCSPHKQWSSLDTRDTLSEPCGCLRPLNHCVALTRYELEAIQSKGSFIVMFTFFDYHILQFIIGA